LDVVVAQSCLTLFPNDETDDDTRTGFEIGKEDAQPHHIVHFMKSQPPKTSKLSSDSLLSIYSMDEMEVETMKRTRAKTPCFWIGQLDCKSREDEPMDPSKALAGQYQAVLPPRSFTPFSESDPVPRKPLRKIKGQQSLRDLVMFPESSTHSDSETLIGTPSLGSPTSGHFSWKTSPKSQGSEDEDHSYSVAGEDGQKDVGFQICMDLLTSELAAGLFKKHPTEKMDRGSGLQILLMIEAYEAVQHHIREEIHDAHVTGAKLDQVKAVEKTLDHWLGALYVLYDRSKSSKSNGSLRDSIISNSPILPLRKPLRKKTVYFDFENPT
jgi:hypothetical protein